VALLTALWLVPQQDLNAAQKILQNVFAMSGSGKWNLAVLTKTAVSQEAICYG